MGIPSDPRFKHVLITQGHRVDRIRNIGSLFGVFEIKNVEDPNLAIVEEWEAILAEMDFTAHRYPLIPSDHLGLMMPFGEL